MCKTWAFQESVWPPVYDTNLPFLSRFVISDATWRRLDSEQVETVNEVSGEGRESGTPQLTTVWRRLLAPLSQAQQGSHWKPGAITLCFATRTPSPLGFLCFFFPSKFDLALGVLWKIGPDFTQRGGSGEHSARGTSAHPRKSWVSRQLIICASTCR